MWEAVVEGKEAEEMVKGKIWRRTTEATAEVLALVHSRSLVHYLRSLQHLPLQSRTLLHQKGTPWMSSMSLSVAGVFFL